MKGLDTYISNQHRSHVETEEFIEYWLDECRQELKELEYEDWMIERLEDEIVDIIEDYKANPDPEAYDPRKTITSMHRNKELDELLFYSV
jgi:uncharacterized protein with von Willebrand factor type A (vWA) domain